MMRKHGEVARRYRGQPSSSFALMEWPATQSRGRDRENGRPFPRGSTSRLQCRVPVRTPGRKLCGGGCLCPRSRLGTAGGLSSYIHVGCICRAFTVDTVATSSCETPLASSRPPRGTQKPTLVVWRREPLPRIASPERAIVPTDQLRIGGTDRGRVRGLRFPALLGLPARYRSGGRKPLREAFDKPGTPKPGTAGVRFDVFAGRSLARFQSPSRLCPRTAWLLCSRDKTMDQHYFTAFWR